jgi:hypothetical protein
MRQYVFTYVDGTYVHLSDWYARTYVCVLGMTCVFGYVRLMCVLPCVRAHVRVYTEKILPPHNNPSQGRDDQDSGNSSKV